LSNLPDAVRGIVSTKNTCQHMGVGLQHGELGRTDDAGQL
jgi:hypothetical protein